MSSTGYPDAETVYEEEVSAWRESEEIDSSSKRSRKDNTCDMGRYEVVIYVCNHRNTVLEVNSKDKTVWVRMSCGLRAKLGQIKRGMNTDHLAMTKTNSDLVVFTERMPRQRGLLQVGFVMACVDIELTLPECNILLSYTQIAKRECIEVNLDRVECDNRHVEDDRARLVFPLGARYTCYLDKDGLIVATRPPDIVGPVPGELHVLQAAAAIAAHCKSTDRVQNLCAVYTVEKSEYSVRHPQAGKSQSIQTTPFSTSGILSVHSGYLGECWLSASTFLKNCTASK